MWKKFAISFVVAGSLLGTAPGVNCASIVFAAEPAARFSIEDAEEYEGHMYAVVDAGGTWHEAVEACKAAGGHLVYVKTEGVQRFLEDLLMMHGTKNSYWLGGEQASPLHGDKWKWLDGTPIEGYSKWAHGQPDNLRETKLMMYRNVNMASKDTKLGEWNDLGFDGKFKDEEFFGAHNFGFICEWDHT